MSNEKVLNIYESLAQEVSKDIDSAREFLKEEGLDSESSFKEKMSPIINRISQFILNEGKKKQDFLQVKYRKFVEKVEGHSTARIIEMYPPLAQTAFRELSEHEISEQDIQNLLIDGGFLTFLESYSEDDAK